MKNATKLVTLPDTRTYETEPNHLPFLFVVRGHLYYKVNDNNTLHQFSLTAPYGHVTVSLPTSSLGDCSHFIARQNNLYCVSKYGLKRYEYCTGTVHNIYDKDAAKYATSVYVDDNEEFAYVPTSQMSMITIDLASNRQTNASWAFGNYFAQLGLFTLDSAYLFGAVGDNYREFRIFSYASMESDGRIGFNTWHNLKRAGITTTSDAAYFAHPEETTTTIAKWCRSCGYHRLFTVQGSGETTSIAVQGQVLYLSQNMKLSTHSLATNQSITSVVSDAPILYNSGSSVKAASMYFPGGEYMYWVTPISETIQKVQLFQQCDQMARSILEV